MRWTILVSTTLAGALAAPGFAHAQMPVTSVVVADARTVDAAPTLTLVGTVEPRRRSRVCTEIAGRYATKAARIRSALICSRVGSSRVCR